METNISNLGSSSSNNNNELLFEAAFHGNVSLLMELVRNDPLILHRPPAVSVSSSPTITSSSTSSTLLPLHIACKLGHTEFALALLRLNPGLSEEVDPHDQSYPLHLAAKIGIPEIAKEIVLVNSDMCFARDNQGMNPVHIAIIKGRIDILDVLIRAAPAAAKERLGVGAGDTALHLCVKRNKVEALKFLVKEVGDEAFLNARDVDGNTILHTAVAQKQLEVIKFLLNDTRMHQNALNIDGLTPYNMISQSNHSFNMVSDREIKRLLKQAKPPLTSYSSAYYSTEKQYQIIKPNYFGSWIDNQRNTLMVVASLIATMAFQAGLNPPGGVWQGSPPSSSPANSPSPSPATTLEVDDAVGTSVMAQQQLRFYDYFLILNTVGLISSMSSILLLISGLPCKKVTVIVVMVAMWAAITTTTGTYLLSLYMLTTPDDRKLVFKIILISALVWLGVMGFMFLAHILVVIVKMMIQMARLLGSFFNCCFRKEFRRIV